MNVEDEKSALVARQKAREWVNLPGLFTWDEVCSLFSTETGNDDGWRFSVHRVSPAEAMPLYSVRAARRPTSCRNEEK